MTLTPEDASTPADGVEGPAPTTASAADRRVLAVLDVIGGATVGDVAAGSGFDPIVLHRWVADFVAAGSAQVCNRPRVDQAAERDRFLAAVAHELRTPLAVARGWAAMVADDDVPPSVLATAGERLESSLDDVIARVRDVEHLAAAALGRLRVDPQPTTISAVLEVAGRDVPRRVDGGGLEVSVDVELTARVVHEMWLAAGSEPAPERRRLQLTADATSWTLGVLREGAAIPIPTLRAMFEPFTANDDSTGVSLGLYLARALSVALGGTIGVEQDDVRTTFWARFPRHAPLPHPTGPSGSTHHQEER